MRRTLFLLLFLGIGLGMEPWRANRPIPSSEFPIRMPLLEKRTLPGGTQLIVHQDSYLPLVHIRFMFRAGYAAEPLDQRGVLELLYRLLFSENEVLIKTLDSLGTEPQLELDSDGVSVSIQVQADDATGALTALAKALREPTWNEAAFLRVQRRLLTQLTERDRSPRASSREALLLGLYPPNHPLHRDPRVLTASIARLKLENVQQAYRQHVVAGNLGVVLAGRIAPVVAGAWVKRELGSLPQTAPPVSVVPVVVPKPRQEILILHYPNLSQTVITFGILAPATDHPDAPALTIAASWLSTHLQEKLRGDKTVSYGLGASYRAGWLGGHMIVQGSVATASTGYAVREVMSQLFAATSATVPAALMPMYRGNSIRNITESYSSLSDTASAAEVVLRRDTSYFAQRIERIQKIGPDDVYKALRDYVPAKPLAIVLAGDADQIQEQVKGLGLGKVRLSAPP